MATELPHENTLLASLYIGNQADMTKSMTELSKLYPDNVKSDETGWAINMLTPQLAADIVGSLPMLKAKFSDKARMAIVYHLGWVLGRHFTTLRLSANEPSIYFEPHKWEWVPIKADSNGADNGDDS